MEDKIKIRNMLNNFFNDIDCELEISDELGNAIVDVHLPKFLALIETERKEAYTLGYKAGWGDDVSYKTNGELEESADESFEGNKDLLSQQSTEEKESGDE